jgi:dTMP kinase
VAAGPGRFITIEGGEGAGKSTQAARLRDALRAAGRRVALTREPGGTPGAEALRRLLLSGEIAWSLDAEVLLHFAARADHVEGLIRPALADGAWVVSDRFFDSTMVYQGFGQGADRGKIRALSAMLGIVPDLTLVLDVPVETSLARLAARAAGQDRYERLGAAFFARVRDGFRTVAAEAPERCALIDATPDTDTVAAAIWECVRSRPAMRA